MVELWFGLLCFMLIMFVVLDGRNIGAGALHLLVARTDVERRQIVAAIGPLWSWHEVWLVAAGGTFLLAFPRVMAVAFSGFYLALWLVLWVLLLRGVSIEVGGHLPDRLWQSGWDFVFAVSNVLLAILLGAALGNVIRGVPLDGTGQFSMSLFGDFTVRGRLGIIDWYTVSVAIFTAVLLAGHGATFLWSRTSGPVHERAALWARTLWIATAVLFAIVSLETAAVRPALYQAMKVRPLAWLSWASIAAGVWSLWRGWHRPAERLAFAGSCMVIVGLLAGCAVCVFPVMLYSTLGVEYSMTAYSQAVQGRGLRVAMLWWPLAVVLALAYGIVVARSYRGKVGPWEDTPAAREY